MRLAHRANLPVGHDVLWGQREAYLSRLVRTGAVVFRAGARSWFLCQIFLFCVRLFYSLTTWSIPYN